MIPVLCDADADSAVALLTDAISCKVTEERNGEFTLEMEYPIDGVNASSINYDMFIVAKPSADANDQFFQIREIKKQMGSGTMIITAYHLRYLLQYCFVMYNPTVVTGCATAISTLISETYPQSLIKKFTISVDSMSTTKKFKTIDIVPTSFSDMMAGTDGSLVDTFGGEWEFDNWKATLHKSRGADNNVLIMYGVNLVDLEYTISVADTYNKCVCYWKDSDDKIQYRPVGSLADTTYFDFESSSGDKTTFTFPKIQLLDMTDVYNDNNNYLNSAGVRSYIQATYDDQWKANIKSITVDFVNLRDTIEYESSNIADVHLCDTVTVICPKLGITFNDKVTKTVYDSLMERYDEITVGLAKKVNLYDVMQGKKVKSPSAYKVDNDS